MLTLDVILITLKFASIISIEWAGSALDSIHRAGVVSFTGPFSQSFVDMRPHNYTFTACLSFRSKDNVSVWVILLLEVKHAIYKQMNMMPLLIFYRVPVIFTTLFSLKGEHVHNIDPYYKTINMLLDWCQCVTLLLM